MTKYIRAESRNSNKTVYHTDQNCVRLDEHSRVVKDAEIEYHDLKLCQWCDPEIDNPHVHEQDHSHRLALIEAAKENN